MTSLRYELPFLKGETFEVLYWKIEDLCRRQWRYTASTHSWHLIGPTLDLIQSLNALWNGGEFFGRFSTWWFQPSWNMLYSQNGNLPQVGVNIENIWNHHLVLVLYPGIKCRVGIEPWGLELFIYTHDVGQSPFLPFSIGNTSRNGGFFIVMLVFGGVLSIWKYFVPSKSYNSENLPTWSHFFRKKKRPGQKIQW